MPGQEIAIGSMGSLTPREAEAVLWVAMGKTSWEAGRILGISEATMNAHVARAAEKLQASNRAHMVARAFVRGVLVPAVQRGTALVVALALALGDHGDALMRRPQRPPRGANQERVVAAAAGVD